MKRATCILPLLALACGSKSGHPIDSAGGTIIADGGKVTLVFPPGAVRSRTDIDVRRADTGALSPAYQLSPEGLAFAAPVRMTIATGASIDSHARIAKLKEDGSYELDGDPTIDAAAQTISAPLLGFSVHGVIITLCQNGCPSQAVDLTATAEPDGRIHLAWGINTGGGGVERFYIERADYPGLAAAADLYDFKFLTLTEDARMTYDDTNLCKEWTYRYRVRSFAVRTLADSLTAPTALALSASQTVCAAPQPDAGMAPQNNPSAGMEGQRGTVRLANFYTDPLTLIVQGETPSSADLLAHNGSRLVGVNPALGSTSTFQLIDNGNMVAMISCTVGQWAWPDGIVGPQVVIQPSKKLSCIDW